MEIKLRRRGEVLTLDGFPVESLPEVLRPTDGLEGIDMTGYSVMYATFGRNGRELARERQGQVSNLPLIYKYEWRNGYGEGVILPQGFNASRVRFYKTDAQVKKEKAGEVIQRAKDLAIAIELAIPGVDARLNYYNEVEVTPKQETFANWAVRASSVEEAQAKVTERGPLWEEWNNRALAAYEQLGLKNPGKGNILISPAPLGGERVGIKFYQKGERFFIFELKEGEWVQTGISVI